MPLKTLPSPVEASVNNREQDVQYITKKSTFAWHPDAIAAGFTFSFRKNGGRGEARVKKMAAIQTRHVFFSVDDFEYLTI